MTAPAGISAQLGFVSESSFGTAATVDTFHPGFVSEAIKQEIARIESAGLRAGRRTTHAWKAGGKTVGGSVTLELWSEPLATLLTHMFGSVATSGSDPYTHTATPGDLTGKSLTVQVGRPDIGGTVRAFTYAGCKLASWTLSGSVGEIPTLELELSAQSEDTDASLESASYPSSAAPFVFTEGSLSIAGSEIAVIEEMSLEAANELATERHRMGSATVREQLENGLREYTGELTADFEDLTAYQRFVNGTEVEQIMKFDNGTESLTITTNTRYDGETPEVGGPEQLQQTLPFKAISSDSDASAITAELANSETTAD